MLGDRLQLLQLGVAAQVRHEWLGTDEIEVLPFGEEAAVPFELRVPHPHMGTQLEVRASHFFLKLPPKRLLVRLAGVDAATRGDPQRPPAALDADQEDGPLRRQEEGTDALPRSGQNQGSSSVGP